jgi:hypothetical protein
MLSRITRLAAVLTIASAGLTLIAPRPAAAASRFACGDDCIHTCCVDDGTCSTGGFCCAFNGTEILACGCGT